MNEAAPELVVTSGEVIALGLFDIAYEIDLGQVEKLWAQQARSASTRSQLSATPAKAVAFGVPPVEIPLDPISLDLDHVPVQAIVYARLYEFGVAVFALHVPANDLTWQAFAERVNAVNRCVGSAVNAPVWTALLQQVRTLFASALLRPNADLLHEDYLIAVAHGFNETLTAAALLERTDFVYLLSGESRALSDGARTDLLRKRFSYYTDDLVVLTFDRAFIYEPRGDSDVIDALEVANAQLLEMRYYDGLLNDELPRMYDLVEGTQRSSFLFASKNFAALARRLYTLVAEVTELTEKVDNALQVTEDVYLARIYTTALELFRVSTVSAALDRKLSIIRDTYTSLYNEASSSRSALMELAIMLLIVIEVVMAVLRH